MREIKFRVWDSVVHCWVPMGLNEISEMVFISPQKEAGHFAIDTFDSKAERHILMQYTGLKDKNGVEIFESDYIESDGGGRGVIMWNDLYMRYDVDTSEKVNGWSHPVYGVQAPTQWTVIGDIYSNPELLK